MGWGRSRHGDIQAAVLIQGGQIVAADIAQCLTRYPCSWIVDLPGLVVSKQTPDVDFVSGATESSYALLLMPSRMHYPKQVTKGLYRRTVALMGTFVTIEVIGRR